MKTIIITLIFLLCICSLHSATIEANSTNYKNFLSSLQPGDTLILVPGNYTNGLPIKNINGLPGKDIVIMSSLPNQAVLVGRDGANTTDITNSSYVVIQDFLYDGKSIDGIDAIKASGNSANYAHHITIRNNTIIGHGSGQQTCAISTKIPARNWLITHNTIIEAGTGLYLGNSDGTMPFMEGIIEFNLVLNPIGYCMQIKQQNALVDLPGLPAANTTTIIRHNVFAKDDRPSPDGDRPNLLVGGHPLSGTGYNSRVEIYGNVFYNNPRENLFQGTDNLSLHDNIFLNRNGGAIALQSQNSRKPKEVYVYNNSIYASGKAGALSSADPAFRQILRANAIFAGQAFSAMTDDNNLSGTTADALNYFTAIDDSLNRSDFFPQGNSQTSNYSLADFSADGAVLTDFNGATKTQSYYGAYTGKGINTGWKLALAIKQLKLPVSVSEFLNAQLSTEISPNPVNTNSIVKFHTACASPIRVSLHNITGKLIGRSEDVLAPDGNFNLSSLVNIDDLPSGIYFLKLETNGQSISLKFQK